MHIHAEGPAFFAWLPKMFGKRVVVTVHGIDWQREKWQSGLGSKFIHQGEKNAAKYADEVIVLSKGVQDYFKETYGRETHFIPNGVNRPVVREAKLITDHFGLEKDSYILFLGRLVPEKGIRYLVEAFKNVNELAKKDNRIVCVHKENGGVSSARNAGLKIATGEYVIFIDGDDWVEPNYVSYLLNLVEKNKCEIGMNKNNYSDDNMNSSDREYVVSDEKAIEWIYLGDIFVAVWNKIYSMQFLKK